jgi:hypothetical protein
MTISSNIRKAGPFVGNGTASTFAFTFKVFQASDLEVVRLNVATTIETILVINSDYTVSLNADQNSNPGGSITLTAGALAAGFNLVITSDIQNLQPTDIVNQGGFYPDVIEDALDRATIQIQQLQEAVDRSAKLPITSSEDADALVADIVALADNQANIDTVATNITSVNTTATNIAAVNTAATNIAAIIAAPTQASNAAASAAAAAASATSAANYVGDIINNPILGDDVFSGNGSTTAFTLSRSVTANTETALLVTINGVVQAPGSANAYSATGTTITFTSAPPTGTNNIRIRYIGALAVDAALAETAATNAASSASSASTSATSASNSATTASTQASNAATSAGSASTSASSASTSATNAAASASSASTSATNAASSATNASNSATTASTAATNAGNSATTASTAATNASNSATSASTSATNASNSASSASTSASNAATSETNAATSATNAANSATSASTSATSASTSATNAAASAASAGAAEIVFSLDNDPAVISSGIKGTVEVPFNCTIDRWTLTAIQSGSITVDIKKSTYSNFPTTTSITGSATPALSSAQKNQSSTLTGWTTSLSAGDILQFEVVGSVTSITQVTLSIKVTR